MFRPNIYQFFSPEHRCKMSQYVYCSEAKCVIEAKEEDSDTLSINLDDMVMSTLAQSFGMQNFLGDDQDLPKSNLIFLNSLPSTPAWTKLASLGTIMVAQVLLKLMHQPKQFLLFLPVKKMMPPTMYQPNKHLLIIHYQEQHPLTTNPTLIHLINLMINNY